MLLRARLSSQARMTETIKIKIITITKSNVSKIIFHYRILRYTFHFLWSPQDSITTGSRGSLLDIMFVSTSRRSRGGAAVISLTRGSRPVRSDL